MDKNARDIKKLIKLIQKIHKKNPDLRFGQLIENAVRNLSHLFYIENDELAMLLTFHYGINK